MSRNPVEDLRSVDRELLTAMRDGEAVGVGELTEQLGVTATAVRQRLERLMEMGLLKGTEIYVEKYAPLQDPLELIVKGYHVSLRVGEAAQIAVDAVE